LDLSLVYRSLSPPLCSCASGKKWVVKFFAYVYVPLMMRTLALVLGCVASVSHAYELQKKSEPAPANFLRKGNSHGLHSLATVESKSQVEVLNPLKAFALMLVAAISPVAASNFGVRTRSPSIAFRSSEVVESGLQQRAKRRKRILIIMSDTGGGHRASALAIVAALKEQYPGKLDYNIVDIWTECGKWPFNTIVKGYEKMAKHPWMWKLMYMYADFPVSQLFSKRIVAMRCWTSIKRILEREDPDLIISVHPLCQHLPLRIENHLKGGAKERRKRMPFVTVVTDLGGAMSMWFHNKVDVVFVPSDAVERLARRHGVPKAKLRKYGLPIRPGFKARSPREKGALRLKLGLRQGMRTTLIVGGGDGVGKMQRITRELARELGADGGGPAQLVVLCGKNKKLKKRLNRAKWPDNVFVKAQGFQSNMNEWLGAVDCIITKAGPGTIAEACATGLPIMLSSRLPGQEEGNVPFVVKGGFGAYSKRPKKIAKTVGKWLRDPQLLAAMSSKSRSAGRPDATRLIAGEIGKCLFDSK